MSKFESFMIELTASAGDLNRALNEGREAMEKLAVAYWGLLPWWAKVAHFLRHPGRAVRLIRAASKAASGV